VAVPLHVDLTDPNSSAASTWTAPVCELALTGARGELINRLLWVVDQDDPPLVGRWWADVGLILAVCAGGSAGRVMPVRDPSAHPRPTEPVGGIPRVERAAYLDILRVRLTEVVNGGMHELFLVRALRDEVGAFLATDYQTARMRRDQFRDVVLAALDDERLRAIIRTRSQRFTQLNDTEMIVELRDMAEGGTTATLAPTEAVARWAAQQAWDQLAAEAIADDRLDRWLHTGPPWARKAAGRGTTSSGARSPVRSGSTGLSPATPERAFGAGSRCGAGAGGVVGLWTGGGGKEGVEDVGNCLGA
jgi:hypothetical protein